MTKKEFIEKIKKSKGTVKFNKIVNGVEFEFVFKNESKKNKEWYSIRLNSKYLSKRFEPRWSTGTDFISDIIRDINEVDFDDLSKRIKENE